jgi:hypothetical protein
MIAQFLSPADSRWRRLLDRVPHDAYHLPEYCVVAGRYECGVPGAFYAEDGAHALLIPILIRDLPEELGVNGNGQDATSPYGYAGPIATAGIPAETLCHALARFGELARERALVSAFIRLHPLRSVSTDVLKDFGVVVNHGPVVYIDLTKSPDQLWAETRSNHRRNIARLSRMGYSVDVDDWSAYPTFRLLYRTTMQRRSARSFYYFSDQYFDQLRDALGDHLHLFTVRGPAGDVAASGLFMIADGIAEYHLGGTDEAHLSNAPSKLMFDVARGWAKALGASVLNLGGGVGGVAGPLQQFKTGFSQTQADFHSVRIVFDDQRYQQLTNANRELQGVDDAPDDFFPAYRRRYETPTPRVSEPA